jgi:hypothetical protein
MYHLGRGDAMDNSLRYGSSQIPTTDPLKFVYDQRLSGPRETFNRTLSTHALVDKASGPGVILVKLHHQLNTYEATAKHVFLYV